MTGEGLARWVAGVRRSAGPRSRILGADRLRAADDAVRAALVLSG